LVLSRVFYEPTQLTFVPKGTNLFSTEQQKEKTMTEITWQDRAKGALMGAFIGDALVLGPHWYYDLEEM